MSTLPGRGIAYEPRTGGSARGGSHPPGAHGTFRSYVTGFALSVVLTAIPFWLVMGDILGDKLKTDLVVMAFAAAQIVVHMIYFLHMNTRSEGGWTFLSLMFTLTLVVIALAGSIWVMYHLDQNMMPMSPHEALHKP
ncbi:cytochrome o ubiquinol oxidase subunit IV [Methylobacterium radiodurans]|uniref:Cytochrome bo(3) ubiquinol oxidase subunit 4 n=1 Tax=Methylobacterium radiodurans TaxID=2202828 RepID=A0A2U8VWL1_9HYPH|nr:cytochrome o ubiquinol oxidase subunit IV [Methylobacterium radiodurans]AWN37691.1 cytochrome o ubiquinol oxidase subunit IV [Methylobacterium radiodurans]